jgi:asparagine synthetase B (glutamine-hydrolysing)
MCGIFGAIGRNLNPGIIRALALINRERGTDSLGFFSNSGKMCKRAGDPIGCLGDADFADFIDKSCYKGWFIAGHTRLATRGRVTTRNAHPFRFGRIIGCHNGCVDLPRKSNYAVDSEYLFDSLNKENGDYQKAFAEIAGYWTLAWFDGSDFYLQAHDNEVCIGRDKCGNWYYSSDWRHLEACTGPLHNVAIISDGVTIRFTVKSRKYERLPTFVSTARWWDVPLFPKKGKKAKKAKKADKDSQAGRIESAVSNSDPFFVGSDDNDPWSRAADFEEYCENDARLD